MSPERAILRDALGIAIASGAYAISFGALATQAIPNPKVFGLDAAPPAAFLALLAPRLRSREPLAIALASAAAAIVLLPFVPAGVPLLVIAVLVALYGVMRRR